MERNYNFPEDARLVNRKRTKWANAGMLRDQSITLVRIPGRGTMCSLGASGIQ